VKLLKKSAVSFFMALLRQIAKNVFFKHINKIIDWTTLEKEIDKVYKRGKSADWRPAYKGILLFKMLLTGIMVRIKR
jgi:IS5 family transposase